MPFLSPKGSLSQITPLVCSERKKQEREKGKSGHALPFSQACVCCMAIRCEAINRQRVSSIFSALLTTRPKQYNRSLHIQSLSLSSVPIVIYSYTYRSYIQRYIYHLTSHLLTVFTRQQKRASDSTRQGHREMRPIASTQVFVINFSLLLVVLLLYCVD